MSHIRNPTGRNQFGAVPHARDPVLREALNKYHREGLENNKKISARLVAEYGITVSESTVKRRRKELELTGSHATLLKMSRKDAEQLVVSQMDKDTSRAQGLRAIKAKIASDTGIHLPRDFISTVMHVHDCEGFTIRDPRRMIRVQKPHSWTSERRACDDRLKQIQTPLEERTLGCDDSQSAPPVGDCSSPRTLTSRER